MSDLLISLDRDIKRCEDVLKVNSYLEIVIAVEELIDKYKNCIEDIGTNNDRVWNYSKKDLENIMDKLKIHRDKFIHDYNESRINSGSVDLEVMFTNARYEIENSKELSMDKIQEIIEIINDLEKISNEKISNDEKWSRLSIHMNWLSNEDINIATNIIYIINMILQNK